VTVRESEAEAIREGYDDVLAGVSLAQIARTWNAAGHRTPQRTREGEPSKWSPSTARDVLLNPRYAGLRGHGSIPEHGRRKVEVIGPAQWPAIVEEETWRATLALLSDPDRKTTNGRGARALLTGIALCGVCGATVHAGGASHGKRIYRCSATFNGSARSSGHVSRLAQPVEEWVSEVVIARLSRPDAVELLHDDKRPDIAVHRARAKALRARLDELASMFGAMEMSRKEYQSARTKTLARLAAEEAQIADAGRVNVLGPLVHTSDVRAVWEALGVDRQRVVIDALMIIRLLPPGQGRRTFRPESVIIEPRV
jgi:site-specific DNA recombinase